MRHGGTRSHRRGRRAFGPVAVSGLAVVSMLAFGTVAVAATGTIVLSKHGPANEGPYPYAYPATGHVKVGTGKTGATLTGPTLCPIADPRPVAATTTAQPISDLVHLPMAVT